MSPRTTTRISCELKLALEAEARRRGVSQSEVVRQAIAAAVRRSVPRAGIIDGPPIADRIGELPSGFGEC